MSRTIPKLTDPAQRPFVLSVSMFLAGIGWFWDKHNMLKDDHQELVNRVVAIEAIEVKPELRQINDKLDALRNLLDERTRVYPT